MNTHFADRCRERGITNTCLETLEQGIAWAVRKKRDDLVERVMSGDGGRTFYRFRCPDGVFYALVEDRSGLPVTIFTGKMMRDKKRVKKRKRRYRNRGK